VKYGYTTLFHRSYANLKDHEKQRINRAIEKFSKHPHHPFPKGLRVHKLEGVYGTAIEPDASVPAVWEMHASPALLITFQCTKSTIIFRNCGYHKAVLQSP
jgi:mRNA-degrading endonuclease YafQ of YafQ-DinJ toxin-antitoxin module